MNEFYLQYHITDRCVNRCTHCYQDSYQGKDVDFEQAKKIILEARSFCKMLNAEFHLALTGGDPLLNKDFWKILFFARKQAERVDVLGNPELLNKANIQKIKKSVDVYQMSLDGFQETHDNFRQKGSFERTINAIKRLSDKSVRVAILSTVSSGNMNELLDLSRFAYKQGAVNWSYSRYVSPNGNCGISSK